MLAREPSFHALAAAAADDVMRMHSGMGAMRMLAGNLLLLSSRELWLV
jgi:hypothetical protein